MKKRGRKSAAELAIQPVTLEQKRPEPPDSLNASMAATWVKVTSCYPPGHFRHDTQPLLEQFCHHTHTAHLLDVEITRFQPEWLRDDDGLGRYKTLLDMREKETRAQTALARSMRLTQQAQYSTKRAATIAEGNHTGPKPWEPK